MQSHDWSHHRRVRAAPLAVLLTYAALAALSVSAMRRVPLDAIPDLSNPQFIVFSEWRGRRPR